MKIAQVAPLFERVPPRRYGGTERVVSYLTEELVRQGHDVTLFASADSITAARLVAPCRKALRLDPACVDPLAHQILMLEMVFREAEQFDVLHFHTDYLHFPLSRRFPIRQVTTLHEGRRTFTVFDGSTSVHDHASVYPRPPYPEDGAIQLLSRSRDLKIVSVR